MKKILAMFLSAIMLCTFFVSVTASPFDDLDDEWWTDELDEGRVVHYADTAPTIDGEIDDVWAVTPKIKSYFDQAPDYAYGYAKLLWREDTLYLLAVITDTTVDVGEDSTSNEACFWVSETYSSGDYEGGNWNVSINQAGVYEYYSGSNLENVATYVSKITPDGYVVEVAVPVQTPDYKYETDGSIGFALSVEDDVNGDDERDCVCASQKENYWSNANNLQLFDLVGGEPEWINPFKDVSESDWYYNDVKYANVNSLMGGTALDIFSPAAFCNRAMLVTVLWRSEGSPVSANPVTFTDVAANEWYTEAVNWASANDIVGGYGNGKFGPNDLITHEQCVLILQRYSNYKKYNAPTISENDTERTFSSWAEDGVDFAEANGLFDGFGTDLSNLTKTASRAELAAYLRRFGENVKK